MKIRILIALLLLSLSVSFVMGACSVDKEQLPNIKEIEASLDKTVSYSVGDVFDLEKIKVIAYLDDDTKREVETREAIIFDTSQLNLDEDDKFSQSGKFMLKINFSEYETSLEIQVSE